MFLVLDPWASILLLVWISHCSFSMLAASIELPRVKATILPHFCAMSLHVSILELANICLIQVGEIIRTIAIKDSIQEVSFVIAAIWPSVPPMAILLAILKSARVPGCI